MLYLGTETVSLRCYTFHSNIGTSTPPKLIFFFLTSLRNLKSCPTSSNIEKYTAKSQLILPRTHMNIWVHKLSQVLVGLSKWTTDNVLGTLKYWCWVCSPWLLYISWYALVYYLCKVLVLTKTLGPFSSRANVGELSFCPLASRLARHYKRTNWWKT